MISSTLDIPRAFEEAILFYNNAKQTQIDLHGREISTESRERFDGFLRCALQNSTMATRTRPAMSWRVITATVTFSIVYMVSRELKSE